MTDCSPITSESGSRTDVLPPAESSQTCVICAPLNVDPATSLTALTALMRHPALQGPDEHEALRVILETVTGMMQVHRTGVWLYHSERRTITTTAAYDTGTGQYTHGLELPLDIAPNYLRAIESNELIAAADACNDPRTCELRDSYLKPHGIGATLDTPVIVGGGIRAILCFEHVGGPREWSAAEQGFAVSVATLVALTLAQAEQRRNERVRAAETRVLEKISSGADLSTVLACAAEGMESVIADSTMSIMLLDPETRTLRFGAGPSLPDELGRSVDGIPIGPSSGSCGTAMYHDKLVVCADIATDPLWAGFSHVALRHGLRACASMPVRDSVGKVVACSAIYRSYSGRPTSWELKLLERINYLVGIAVERHTKQARMRSNEEQLRQAQRLESIGQLTGGIAHDFNNLLTVILGNAELLASEMEADDSLSSIASTIVDSAQLGAELTQRLLAFARRQDLEPRPTNVNELVGGMQGLLHRTLGEAIQLQCHYGPDVPLALIDAAQLESALLNLCLNARDALPDGGSIRVETSAIVIEEHDAGGLPTSLPAGEYIRISVSDDGIGIPADCLDRVFEPFYTTKGKAKGTGLGLSMVYGFVTQSSGQVHMQSESGVGTTVTIYLPKATPTVSETDIITVRQPRDARSRAQADGGGESVLLVEDDSLVRQYASNQLITLGYQVIEAENGFQALELLEQRNDIDLLLTDIIMPGMNGRELADRASTMKPGLPVLFTSGYTDNADLLADGQDTDRQLLKKPYRRAELAHLVSAAISRSPGRDPKSAPQA